jgi:hypothetical protein
MTLGYIIHESKSVVGHLVDEKIYTDVTSIFAKISRNEHWS